MKIFELSGHNPLAEGNRRLVFQHPDDDDLVIKVLKPGTYRPDGQPRRSRPYKLARREGAYIYHTRELNEYVAARIANRSPHDLPICTVQGLVETDLGLGLAVEKITAGDGRLAPSLRQVVAGGRFDGPTRRLFERFIEDMIDKHVVVYELSVDNIVLADDGVSARRFVCIDGMGSRTLIPVKEWSKWLNARKIRSFREDFLRRWAGEAADAPWQRAATGMLRLLAAPILVVFLAME